MSILRSALVRAILIPLAMALALTACSAQTLPAAQSASAPGTTVAADTGTGTVTTLAAKKYTMAQVRKHHTRSNCWTVIGKNVYKLTKFIKKHPGGSKRIIAICGKNGTASFRGQHGTGGSANSILKKYKLGVLA